ncbi:MAG: 50S ribosomal protein L24 [Chitinophagaceae bacterium]|jgi:large subunit ribosomal protein L24|nr:50S ribosomal protein L24 [Chitinophagaceae bacterium]OQY93885.1 MAG: 50S ribosomal protein L24 [Sphingobacteriales bacterium UTBCD1]
MKARFKPKYNIKKGDSVVVITGEDKDLSKPRTVKSVLLDKSKVIVEGVNMITRHSKPSAQNTKGGIIKKEAPIHISNVMLWDPAQKSGARVTRERKNGKTVKVFKTVRKSQEGKK